MLPFVVVIFFLLFFSFTKLKNSDGDIKCGAVHDLKEELEKTEDILDGDLQENLWSSVIDLFENESEKIQKLPLICIVPLMKHFSHEKMTSVVEDVFYLLCNPTQGIRDAAYTALKKIFTEIPFELFSDEIKFWGGSKSMQLMSLDDLYEKYTKMFDGRLEAELANTDSGMNHIPFFTPTKMK